ncbi:hypothetical protein D3C72_2061930 [compost metagenome]
MFGQRPLDPDTGLTEVMGRIEQTIEFVCREFAAHLRIVAEHGAQMALFGYCTLAAGFQQMMRGVATQALGQDDTDRFSQH